MIEVLSFDQLLVTHAKRFVSKFFKLRVSSNDFFEFGHNQFADLLVAFSFGFAQLLDHAYDPVEDIWPIVLDIAHEISKFLILRTSDDEPVALFKEKVDFFGEFSVREESVTDFEVAIVFIVSPLILP